MNILVLLRGIPGSGKSTFIDNNNLERFTLSPDTFRTMLQSPALGVNGKYFISQKNDNEAWEMTRSILERRMGRGDFTVIDATHSRNTYINSYKDLCEKYRYRCYVVDFSDVPLETCLERNRNRPESKFVPESAIKLMHEKVKEPLNKFATVIKPEHFWETFKELPCKDFSGYDTIHFIGDIHGCYSVLQEYYQQVKENDYVVFLGDYFDRGIENVEVFNFLDGIKDNPNITLLKGNHEEHFWKWAVSKEDETVKLPPEANITLLKFIEAGITKSKVRQLFRKMGTHAYFTYNNKYVFACHGGVPVVPDYFTSSQDIVKGVGKYENHIEIAEVFNSLEPENVYQVHGHRNVFDSPIQNGRVFNLCDKVEFGEYLRVLTLDKDGFKEHKIRNNVFYIPEKVTISQEESETSFLESLRTHKYIKETKLENNVSSFNFTRDAFFGDIWDNFSIKARGLFVNTETGEVVARGYEKFFNLDEKTSTKLINLNNTLNFPVTAYLKYNGYLGLVGWNNGLFISSKTTNKSDHANWFKNSLLSKVSVENLEEVTKKYSLAFEVIEPVNDPHIISYKESDIVLLDAFERNFEFKKLDYISLCKFANSLGVKVKQAEFTFSNMTEFYAWLKEFQISTIEIEGYVLEDSKGFMFKLKSPYYKEWKHLRHIVERLRKGQLDKKLLNSELQVNFVKWIQETNPELVDIITLREAYYEYLRLT